MFAKIASPSSGLIARVRRFFAEDVWRVPVQSRLRGWLYAVIRVLLLTIQGFRTHKCLAGAAALTYVTVLSLVPFLAFAFSIAKGFGAYDALRQRVIEPFLDETFGKLNLDSAGTQELRHAFQRVLDFVDHTNVSSLGLLGLLALVYMVVKLLGNVESTLNEIWEAQRPRSLVRRVTDYLAIAIIAPIALITATGVTAAAQNSSVFAFLHETLGLATLIALGVRLVPLLAVFVAFTFLYAVMPNTRVKLLSALIGGIVGGGLWQLAQIAHVKFQLGVAKYNALYAGFAVFPIFLVWLYLSWVIVLLGAQLAAAHQMEPRYRGLSQTTAHDRTFLDFLALRAMTTIGAAFLAGRVSYTMDALAEELAVPGRLLDEALTALVNHGLLVDTGARRNIRYLPARDLDLIKVKDVLGALRGSNGSLSSVGEDPRSRAILATLLALDTEVERSPHNVTIKQLASESP
jgi:membrane protein